MLEELNKKVKNLDALDIVLTKWAAVVAGILLIKLFPSLLGISYTLLFIALIVLAAKPCYDFFSK
jgi:hypothetical protein